MPNYVQHTPKGFVHTIMSASNPLEEQPGIVEIAETDPWFMGSYYNGAEFMRLEVTPDNNGQAPLNTPLTVHIRWAAKDGQTVARTCTLTAACNGMTEPVEVINGVGVMSFESPEPGIFEIRVTSPEGVTTTGRVVIA
ncbi:MAG: hypothetical protein ACYC6C_12650 [Coriobacteriia bacterium]